MCIMLAPTSAFPELGRRKGHLQQCRTNEIVYDLVDAGSSLEILSIIFPPMQVRVHAFQILRDWQRIHILGLIMA